MKRIGPSSLHGRITAEGETGASATIAAITPGSGDPRLFYAAAQEEMARRNYKEALAVLEQGLVESPEDGALLVARGTALAAIGRHQLAALAFEQALERAPRSYVAGLGLGLALCNSGEYERSERQYQFMAAAAPASSDPLAGMALLAAQRGDAENAIALANSALASRSDDRIALQALLDAALLRSDYAGAEQIAQGLLKAPPAAGFDPSLVSLRLGDALHGQCCYEQAFDAYVEGKAGFERQHREEFEAEDRETPRARAERLLEDIGPVDLGDAIEGPVKGAGTSEARAHGFIAGFPRSGTTLLEEVLAAHPDIVSLDERPTLVASETSFIMEPGGLERLAKIDADGATLHRKAYWQAVDGWAPDRGRRAVIDKGPLRSMSLPVIAKLFPDARVLLCIRDPRDVVFSCFRRGFAMNPSTYEFTGLERTARFYDAVMRLIRAYRRKLELNLRVVRHETLVTDFHSEMAAILDFMGLPWSDHVSDFASSARKRPIRTPSANQIRQGLNGKGVGQWKAYEQELRCVLPILDPWIRYWGYEL